MSDIASLAKLLRYYSLVSTTKAGSGHPSSCLSAADLIAGLVVNDTFHYDINNPQNIENDRLIFSKGHAAPLFYAFWTIVGGIEEKELMTLRQFESRLEGHPTKRFPFTEVPTGSLGQGLSVGFGMALNAKYIDKLEYKTFVLMGDSELAEGSVWETMAEASFYKLNNLIGLIDMNRLGQRGETMLGHDAETLATRVSAFGWETIVIDGHNYEEIQQACKRALVSAEKPVMIIAKTLKGKGVALLENKDGWHGKTLNQEQLATALEQIGDVDLGLRIKLSLPRAEVREQRAESNLQFPVLDSQLNSEFSVHSSEFSSNIATRKAYGLALAQLVQHDPRIVVLDAEVSNSTHAEEAKKVCPERFFEMFIAEQNMVGVAIGLAERGRIPFVSTFAAFFTRAFDQIRMAGLAESNIKFIGSHAGVSIGEDGASQMGLEDIAMFRAIWGSVVLYPADAFATEKLVQVAAQHHGLVYLRTTRKDTPLLYSADEEFSIGGSKVLKQSREDVLTIVAAGITVHEALAAYEELMKENIFIRIIDLYSVKPIDYKTLEKADIETKGLLVVEDHYEAGGIAEAVRSALPDATVYSLAVHLLPRSGTPQELLEYEGISARAIINKVKSLL